ncbi:hypothetical protein ACTJK4_22030, partial [Ralstonia sp. 22111]|uniref:hypothetical protein n=1 Tax=Ralstonia sp. 22111 TaxID=3453878 RepID=UPI003F82A1ED
GKLAALKQFPVFVPPAYTNSRRHLGQERQRPNRWCAGPGGSCLLLLLLALLRVVLLVPAAVVL